MDQALTALLRYRGRSFDLVFSFLTALLNEGVWTTHSILVKGIRL